MTTLDVGLERRRSVHTRWASALTLAACALAAVLPTPSIVVQMSIVGAAVALLGFPHGAVDPLVAGLREEARGVRGLAWFLAAYVALAAAALGLWILSPAAGLALFLASSMVHFGLGDVPPAADLPGRRRALRVLAHGAAPIVVPAALHAGDVGLVFGWLLGVDGAHLSASLTSARAPLLAGWAVVALCAYAGPSDARRARGALELTLLFAAFALLPPLLSFAVYFCVWHSARHLITVDAVLGEDLRARALVVGLAVLAATALLLLGAHVSSSDPGSVDSIARTIFIALAALTPPHMIVTSVLEDVRSRTPGR